VLCTNVTVKGLYIKSDGPNTDGCDPESCTDVLIKECFFDTGDDCIAIKAGRNDDGRRVKVPSTNIVIQQCRMKNGHGGITIGSEISAGVSNVFAERCRLDSPELDFAVRVKNNALRGGLLEHIYVRHLEIGQVAKAAVTIDFTYEEGKDGPHTPVCRDVIIEDLTTQKADYAAYLIGFPNAPITNVSFLDCDFKGVAKGNHLENVQGVSVEQVKINGAMVKSLNLP
jgi:polygalacturonase